MHKIQKIRKKIESQHQDAYQVDYGQPNHSLKKIFWKSKPKILQKKLIPNVSIFPLLSHNQPQQFFNNQISKANL